MAWRIENVKNNSLRYFLSVGVFGSLLACIPVVQVAAVDSEIGVSVCGAVAPSAQIDITQPLNDSVVDQASTTFRATVGNTTQVEIEVDGQYSNTVAIAANSTAFQYDVLLQEGTHTISMTANAICGGPEATDSVVVTYQPATLPSNGGSTPTVLDGTLTLEGEAVNPEPLNDNDFMQQIEQLPIIGAAVSVVADFATAIGLESTVANGNAPAVTGIARVAVTVAALTSVVMASTLAPLAAQALPGVSEVFNVKSHRSMIYLGWVIRGVGVLALAFAYFL